VQIHPGHDQSTGEGMTVAMPRIVFETSSLDSGEEPATRTLGVGKDEVSIRLFSQSFECQNRCSVQGNVPWISIFGPGEVNLAARKVDLGPLETVLLAHADAGMGRQKQVWMKTTIGGPE
jgi:hypothetical protein